MQHEDQNEIPGVVVQTASGRPISVERRKVAVIHDGIKIVGSRESLRHLELLDADERGVAPGTFFERASIMLYIDADSHDPAVLHAESKEGFLPLMKWLDTRFRSRLVVAELCLTGMTQLLEGPTAE